MGISRKKYSHIEDINYLERFIISTNRSISNNSHSSYWGFREKFLLSTKEFQGVEEKNTGKFHGVAKVLMEAHCRSFKRYCKSNQTDSLKNVQEDDPNLQSIIPFPFF